MISSCAVVRSTGGTPLSLSQILEYGSQLEEIQKKEQEKNKPGRGMVGAGSGMKATPRRAVESLGLSEEKLSPLLELVKEYEAKSLEESKKRSALLTEAGKLNKSESGADRAQGAELLKKVAQIKMPSAAELDVKILAGLSVEQQAKYKELRKIDDAGKMPQASAATGGKAPIAEKPVEKSTEKGIEKPAGGEKGLFRDHGCAGVPGYEPRGVFATGPREQQAGRTSTAKRIGEGAGVSGQQFRLHKRGSNGTD